MHLLFPSLKPLVEQEKKTHYNTSTLYNSLKYFINRYLFASHCICFKFKVVSFAHSFLANFGNGKEGGTKYEVDLFATAS